MQNPAQALSVTIVLDESSPAPELAQVASRLLPPDTDWTVVVTAEQHPALTTGATGFAAPVLSPEEMEARFQTEQVQADAAAAATARALGDRSVRQVVVRGGVVGAIQAMFEDDSCDLVVVGSTDLAKDLTHNDIPRVLAIPSTADIDVDGPVLVAVDDSPLDERIADTVATLFRSASEILTLHVTPTMPPVAPPAAFGVIAAPMPPDLGQPLAEEAQQAAERTTERIGLRDVTPVGAVGDPVDGILEAADEHGAAIIVLGSRDRSWLSRLFDPSVSDAVRRRADRPILILR